MSSIFQRAYDFIKAIKTPTWLKELLQSLQDIMLAIAKKAGQDYIAYLEAMIVEASLMNNLSSKQKFDYVFGKAKSGGISAIITLKDNEISTLINFLYSQYKKAKGE
jgi:hypothetical protein